MGVSDEIAFYNVLKVTLWYIFWWYVDIFNSMQVCVYISKRLL